MTSFEKLSFNELASEGERLCKSGDCLGGIKFFEQALRVYESGTGMAEVDEVKVLQTLSIIYNQMGNAYFYLQNYKRALEFHKKDLALSEQFGDDSGMAKACGNIGNTLQLLGEYDEAINYSLRNLETSQKLGDSTGEARALYNLGNIYQSKGKHMGRVLCNRDPAEFPLEVKDVLMHAVSYYRKTLELVANKDRAAEGRTYGNLGNTYYLLGDFESAVECHSERLKIAKEYGDKAAERRAYSNLGNAYIFMGKFNEATEFYLKAMNVAKVLGDRAIEAQTYYSLGNTYTLLQDYTIAIDYHLRHLQIAKQLMDRVGESRAYWSLGNAYAALGEIENAISYANKHLEVAKEIGDTSSELTAKMNLYDFQSLLGYSRESEAGLFTPISKYEKKYLESNSNHMNSMKKSNTIESFTTYNQDSAPNKTNDDTSFLDVLSRVQSKRLDDQRCSFRLIPPNEKKSSASKLAGSHNKSSKNELISNTLLKEDAMPGEDFFELIMKCQSSRLEDQRSTIMAPPAKPNIPQSHSHMQLATPQRQMALPHNQENNHGTLSTDAKIATSNAIAAAQFKFSKQQAITVPPQDEEFFMLIQKLQSRRLDEQRSEIPKTMTTSAMAAQRRNF